MRERTAIDVFELAADRDAVREPARAYARHARDLREHVRGRLAFHGRIGRDDELLHFAFGQALRERVEAELLRAKAVEWRKTSEQDEIAAAITGRLFDSELVDRRFDDAQEALVTRAARA